MADSERSLSSSLINSRNGFCVANSTFYSKRNPLQLLANTSLDITTFISSQGHSSTTAFVDASLGHRISFSDFWRAVDRVADCLYHDIGIRRGDVILILSPNFISIPIVYLAVMSLGAVVTTVNPLNTVGEISRQISDSKPRLAFAAPELAPKLAAASAAISVVLNDEEHVGSTQGVRIVGVLSEMMKNERSGRRVKDRINRNETAMLLYSSGTTGKSKGVDSSHANLIAQIARFIVEPLEPNQSSLEVAMGCV